MEYPRSHTDPLANLVVLSALDIQQHLPEIRDHDFPIATLPSFLHETTHHWCFDSPVGVALHLLFLQARRAAWLSLAHGSRSDHSWDVLDKVVRYEIALHAIRPLSEGIALFAEHDVIPGDARTISRPMSLVAGLYGRGVGVLSDPPYEDLPTVLAAGRLSTAHVRRKADLLIQPMTCETGGYLPGYLLVKALWQTACARSSKFFDTDFFLQFVRSHFFEDWGLVGKLLDPGIKDISALDPIREQIGLRLSEFVETVHLGDRPQAFEDLLLSGKTSVLPIHTKLIKTDFPYLPLETGSQAQTGRQRLKEVIESMFSEWPDEPANKGLVRQDQDDITLRGLVTIGHAQFEGRLDDDGFEIRLNETVIGKFPKITSASHKNFSNGPVDVDLVALPSSSAMVFVVTRDRKTVFCQGLGDTDVPSYLGYAMIDRRNRAADSAQWRLLIQEALEKADLNEDLRIVRSSNNREVDRFYLRNALLFVDDARRDNVLRELCEDGLLNLLDRDLNLVKDAAAASLCLPFGFSLRTMDPFHRWSTGDANSALSAINELLESRIGFQPFAFDNGQVLPMSFI